MVAQRPAPDSRTERSRIDKGPSVNLTTGRDQWRKIGRADISKPYQGWVIRATLGRFFAGDPKAISIACDSKERICDSTPGADIRQNVGVNGKPW
jgi:hypothetical protein